MARKPVFYVKHGSTGKNNRRFTLDTCLECGVINVIRSLCVYGRVGTPGRRTGLTTICSMCCKRVNLWGTYYQERSRTGSDYFLLVHVVLDASPFLLDRILQTQNGIHKLITTCNSEHPLTTYVNTWYAVGERHVSCWRDKVMYYHDSSFF